MSITTGSGDKGQTSLWSGERVPKSSLRVESYGTIDELNSFLGETRHYVKTTIVKETILTIQRDLFRVAGGLATLEKPYMNPLTDEDVERVTSLIHKFEKEINLKGFVVPGNTMQSAKLDVCRTISRRAERRILSLNETEKVNKTIIVYVNRLSDMLFILARYEEFKVNKILYK